MRSLVFATFFVASILNSVNCARILGIFHVTAYSHHQLGDRIFKELASRGHEVTVITPYAEKNPVKNMKQIVLTGFVEEAEERNVNVFEFVGKTIIEKFIAYELAGLYMTERTLNHTSVQEFLNSNEHFDLIIIEQFLNEAFRGFCHKFKAPCVILSTVGGSRWTNPQMANPESPSYVPDLFINLSSKMNFLERLYNSLVYTGAIVFSHLYTLPRHNKLLHQYFPDAPHLYDLYYNTSLILLNSHVSANPPVPYVPNMIEIGGYHINPPKQLPKDLQDYLDGAKEGAIYFSMGSNIRSKDLPEDKRNAMLKVFSRLKQKVLWKWEEETLPGQPSNVKLSKWFPQQDILAHPNLRLFISHGGLLSTFETLYHSVPIVGIPIFGDQEMNVANAEIAGYGIGLPFKDLNEERFEAVLQEALNNPKYTQNAKLRSKVLHDQPMKPLDTAMFWIEYILRHQGAPHLKSAALNLAWYQYLLLDVIALIGFVMLVIVYTVYKLFKLCCSRKSSKKVNHQKKKD